MAYPSYYCKNCLALVMDVDKFCASCGTPVTGQKVVNSPPRQTPSSVQTIGRPTVRTEAWGDQGKSSDQYQRDQYRVMGAYSRSFTTPAVITLVLYWVLWIPGFIANIIYLNEANKIQKVTGEAPEGKGCLVAMMLFGLLAITAFCGIWAFLFGALAQ